MKSFIARDENKIQHFHPFPHEKSSYEILTSNKSVQAIVARGKSLNF